MTVQEFDRYIFSIQTVFDYKGKERCLHSLSFQEKLLCFLDERENEIWVRCENVS